MVTYICVLHKLENRYKPLVNWWR